MTASARRLLFWTPRILGIVVALFLAAFALDSFGEGIPALLVHLLPSVLLLSLVASTWRREWLGGSAFILLAAAYAVFAWRRDHADWALVISGPMLVVGLLFIWSWHGLHGRGPTARVP